MAGSYWFRVTVGISVLCILWCKARSLWVWSLTGKAPVIFWVMNLMSTGGVIKKVFQFSPWLEHFGFAGFVLDIDWNCKLRKHYAGLNSTTKSATTLLFLDSRIVLGTLFFVFPSFFLTLCGIADRNWTIHPSIHPSPFLFFLGYNGYLVTHFLWIVTQAMSWPDEIRWFSHMRSL